MILTGSSVLSNDNIKHFNYVPANFPEKRSPRNYNLKTEMTGSTTLIDHNPNFLLSNKSNKTLRGGNDLNRKGSVYKMVNYNTLKSKTSRPQTAVTKDISGVQKNEHFRLKTEANEPKKSRYGKHINVFPDKFAPLSLSEQALMKSFNIRTRPGTAVGASNNLSNNASKSNNLLLAKNQAHNKPEIQKNFIQKSGIDNPTRKGNVFNQTSTTNNKNFVNNSSTINDDKFFGKSETTRHFDRISSVTEKLLTKCFNGRIHSSMTQRSKNVNTGKSKWHHGKVEQPTNINLKALQKKTVSSDTKELEIQNGLTIPANFTLHDASSHSRNEYKAVEEFLQNDLNLNLDTYECFKVPNQIIENIQLTEENSLEEAEIVNSINEDAFEIKEDNSLEAKHVESTSTLSKSFMVISCEKLMGNSVIIHSGDEILSEGKSHISNLPKINVKDSRLSLKISGLSPHCYEGDFELSDYFVSNYAIANSISVDEKFVNKLKKNRFEMKKDFRFNPNIPKVQKANFDTYHNTKNYINGAKKKTNQMKNHVKQNKSHEHPQKKYKLVAHHEAISIKPQTKGNVKKLQQTVSKTNSYKLKGERFKQLFDQLYDYKKDFSRESSSDYSSSYSHCTSDDSFGRNETDLKHANKVWQLSYRKFEEKDNRVYFGGMSKALFGSWNKPNVQNQIMELINKMPAHPDMKNEDFDHFEKSIYEILKEVTQINTNITKDGENKQKSSFDINSTKIPTTDSKNVLRSNHEKKVTFSKKNTTTKIAQKKGFTLQVSTVENLDADNYYEELKTEVEGNYIYQEDLSDISDEVLEKNLWEKIENDDGKKYAETLENDDEEEEQNFNVFSPEAEAKYRKSIKMKEKDINKVIKVSYRDQKLKKEIEENKEKKLKRECRRIEKALTGEHHHKHNHHDSDSDEEHYIELELAEKLKHAPIVKETLIHIERKRNYGKKQTETLNKFRNNHENQKKKYDEQAVQLLSKKTNNNGKVMNQVHSDESNSEDKECDDCYKPKYAIFSENLFGLYGKKAKIQPFVHHGDRKQIIFLKDLDEEIIQQKKTGHEALMKKFKKYRKGVSELRSASRCSHDQSKRTMNRSERWYDKSLNVVYSQNSLMVSNKSLTKNKEEKKQTMKKSSIEDFAKFEEKISPKKVQESNILKTFKTTTTNNNQENMLDSLRFHQPVTKKFTCTDTLYQEDSNLYDQKNVQKQKKNYAVKLDYQIKSNRSIDLKTKYDTNIEENWQRASELYSQQHKLNEKPSAIINTEDQTEYILAYLKQQNIFAFNDVLEEYLESTIKNSDNYIDQSEDLAKNADEIYNEIKKLKKYSVYDHLRKKMHEKYKKVVSEYDNRKFKKNSTYWEQEQKKKRTLSKIRDAVQKVKNTINLGNRFKRSNNQPFDKIDYQKLEGDIKKFDKNQTIKFLNPEEMDFTAGEEALKAHYKLTVDGIKNQLMSYGLNCCLTGHRKAPTTVKFNAASLDKLTNNTSPKNIEVTKKM